MGPLSFVSFRVNSSLWDLPPLGGSLTLWDHLSFPPSLGSGGWEGSRGGRAVVAACLGKLPFLYTWQGQATHQV